MSTPTPNRLLTEKQAAEYLALSPNTLKGQRSKGAKENGLPPIPFIRYSERCIRYSTADLDKWVAALRVEGDSA